jgi:hypothetical protein
VPLRTWNVRLKVLYFVHIQCILTTSLMMLQCPLILPACVLSVSDARQLFIHTYQAWVLLILSLTEEVTYYLLILYCVILTTVYNSVHMVAISCIISHLPRSLQTNDFREHNVVNSTGCIRKPEQPCRYSDWATGCTTEESRLGSLQEQDIVFSKASRPGARHT